MEAEPVIRVRVPADARVAGGDLLIALPDFAPAFGFGDSDLACGEVVFGGRNGLEPELDVFGGQSRRSASRCQMRSKGRE